MTALMQEVVERVHALPDYRQDDVVSRLLGVISEEETAPKERIFYIEIADDLTDEERAELEEARKQMREHPEESIDFDDFLAENGITEEEMAKYPVKLVYNL
jgi:hypothetical protein